MNDNSFVFQTRLANLSCDPETVRQGRQRKSVRKGVWIFSQRDVRWQNWKPSDYGSGKPIPSEKHRLAFTVRKYALVVTMIRWNKKLLEDAAKNSTSISGILDYVGLKHSGGSHSHVKTLLNRYDVDTKHFYGRGSNRGFKHTGGCRRLSWQEVLVRNRLGKRKENASRLRRAMLECGIILGCVLCGQSPYHNGRELSLEIDHIDGDNLNNQINNLRFLCLNCHSQTETYGSKNRL